MKYSNFKNPNSNLTEEELSKRLFLNLMGIIIFIVVAALSLFVFAPKIGALFGLISVHHNEKGYTPTVKISAPYFVDVPNFVKESTVTLKGYAEANATVKVFANGPEAGSATVSADGTFTIPNIKMISGRNTLFAKAIDKSGNESDKSETFYITLDKDAPKIDPLTPKDGETIRNLNKRIAISGTLSEKATITINDKHAVVKPDLTFEFLLGTEEGTIKIKIVATDEAGNETKKEFSVKYEKKSI